MSSVCRVCLTGGGNVTLCSLEDVRLKDVYKKLTNTQFYSEDGRPRVVCSFCYQNLLKCWTLSEMARRSENIFSNLLLKGLEATYETIEDLNLGTKKHLSVAPMQCIDLDKETLKNSSAIIIKEEPIFVKEEESVQVDELADTESADTLISEECINSQWIFKEDSNNDNYLIENSTEMDIVQQNLENDTENLDSDEEQVEVQPEFCCAICSKMFLVRSRLVSHIKLSHTKEQQCKTFDEKLSDIYSIRPKIVHTGDKPYACSICDMKFTEKSHLVNHLRAHTEVKPHACGMCDKQYKHKYDLRRHMKIHTGVKPYACSLCDKKYTEKSRLVRHMRIHTGEKPYACSICDKQFKDKNTLVRHLRIHTGEKSHACSICDKKFKQKCYLVKHMKIHNVEKPYACGTCCKQFNRKSNLISHIRIHTGEKPYTCSICDKQFKDKSTLVTHMRIHNGEKTVCSICDKQFKRKSGLILHMRIHTRLKLRA